MSDEEKGTQDNSLWRQFETKLEENETKFEELDVDTDWKDLLKEFGFTTLEIGKLLKEIKSKKQPEKGLLKVRRASQPGDSCVEVRCNNLETLRHMFGSFVLCYYVGDEKKPLDTQEQLDVFIAQYSTTPIIVQSSNPPSREPLRRQSREGKAVDMFFVVSKNENELKAEEKAKTLLKSFTPYDAMSVDMIAKTVSTPLSDRFEIKETNDLRMAFQALNVVHEAGIIHGDIKSEHIRAAKRGPGGVSEVFFIDFGAAVFEPMADLHACTPKYCSFEQLALNNCHQLDDCEALLMVVAHHHMRFLPATPPKRYEGTKLWLQWKVSVMERVYERWLEIGRGGGCPDLEKKTINGLLHVWTTTRFKDQGNVKTTFEEWVEDFDVHAHRAKLWSTFCSTLQQVNRDSNNNPVPSTAFSPHRDDTKFMATLREESLEHALRFRFPTWSFSHSVGSWYDFCPSCKRVGGCSTDNCTEANQRWLRAEYDTLMYRNGEDPNAYWQNEVVSNQGGGEGARYAWREDPLCIDNDGEKKDFPTLQKIHGMFVYGEASDDKKELYHNMLHKLHYFFWRPFEVLLMVHGIAIDCAVFEPRSLRKRIEMCAVVDEKRLDGLVKEWAEGKLAKMSSSAPDTVKEANKIRKRIPNLSMLTLLVAGRIQILQSSSERTKATSISITRRLEQVTMERDDAVRALAEAANKRQKI